VLARLVITWLTNCIGLLVASAIIGPISYGDKLGTLLLAGLVLGVVNFLVRPLLILLTLPAVILTLGIFLLLINALMLWLTSKIVGGFHVGGFWSTVGGALILWLVNMALRPWTKYPWSRRGHGGDRDAGGDGQRWQVWVGRGPSR
jgi:putative membrane protein